MPPKPKSPPLTHFLCIPLLTPHSRPQVEKSLLQFRQDCITKTKSPDLPNGIPEKAIRPIGTLHLTLGVMSLPTQKKIDEALKVLREIDIKALLSVPSPVKFAGSKEKIEEGPKNLMITLEGVQSMQTPEKSSTLYTPPLDPSLRLYTFCNSLLSHFVSHNLMSNPTRPLLLHASLMNTTYAKGVKAGGSGHGKKSGAKLVVDARDLIDEWEGREFMRDVRVERLSICRMGAERGMDGEERYVEVGGVDVPDF